MSRRRCRVQLLLNPFLAECSHKEAYVEDADHHGEGELSREENIVSESPHCQHLGASLMVQLLHCHHAVVAPCQDLRDSLMEKKTSKNSGLSSAEIVRFSSQGVPHTSTANRSPTHYLGPDHPR